MTSAGGKLARDSFWMIAVQIYGRGLTLLFSLYAAHALGVEKFGVYGYAMAVITMVAALIDFGSNTYQIKETAIITDIERRRVFLTESLIFRTGLSVLGFLLILILASIIPDDKTAAVLIILFGVGTTFNNISFGFTQTLIGLESFKIYGLLSMLSQTINIGAACLMIYAGYGLYGIGYVYSGWGILSLIVMAAVFMGKHYIPTSRFSFAGVRSFFRGAIPIGVTAILVTLYYKSDYIILEYFKGTVDVGLYNAAYVIVNAMIFIPTTISTTLLPRLSFYSGNDKSRLELIYRHIFKYLFFAGFGLGSGAVAVSSDLIAAIYPVEFRTAYIALSILIWALALIFVNSMQGNMLVALGKQRLLPYVTGAAAVVNIGLNFILIPRYGMRGAAYTTVLAELVAGISCFYILRRLNGLGHVTPIIVRAAVAGLIMYVILIFMQQTTLFIRVPLGIAVYFAVLFISRGLTRADLQPLKDMLSRD